MDSSSSTSVPVTVVDKIAPYPEYVGYITILLTCLFWGCAFLPVKKFETGDGLFFQLFVCLGIWGVSFVVNCIRDFPQFYALPLLCGITWAVGNITLVPIVKFIGLSLGYPIWAVVGLIVGWVNARFGVFGSKPQVPKIIWMNYVGVVIAAISVAFYIFVKSEVTESGKGQTKVDIEQESEFKTVDGIVIPNKLEKLSIENERKEEKSFIDNINPKLKRIFGVLLAIFAGVMYGLNYAPILYVMDNYENASNNGLDYLHSFCTGTLISAIVFILAYCIFKKNKPIVYPNAILPGFATGILWSFANLSFLIASDSLSQAVVYPIGMTGPPMVAALNGIIFFREIRGKRNLIILSVGFLFTITGSVLCGLSK